MTTMHAIPGQVRDWIAARTPRERMLVALAGAALSVALCAELTARVLDARVAAGEALAARAELERQATAQGAASFRVAAEESARAARRASMGGETIHVARARAQAEVESLAAAAGLAGVSVTLEPRPDTAALVEPIVMRVEGAYDADGFAAFLAQIGQSERSLAPGLIDVSTAGGAGRFRMDLTGYALLEASR